MRRHSASIVHTSDRRRGRAIGGLADALALLDGDDCFTPQVAHPEDAMWQYRGHAFARRAFGTGDMAALAALLGLSVGHVVGVACECPNDEAFAMRIVPTPPGVMREIPLSDAEQILDRTLDGERLYLDLQPWLCQPQDRYIIGARVQTLP